MSGPVGDEQGPTRPLLRVVKGDPSDEELAALVAVVSALGAAQVADEKKPRSEWSAHHRTVRTALAPGWRSSALPR
ncbi:MAG: acyl-CoA carboxylase subunit epsilon [Nocardioidaceae bacterium]